MTIDENGLVFGAGTCFARMKTDGRLALDRERVLVLLSVVYRTPVAASMLHHIEAASGHWQRSDWALANLRLVFAGLPQLDDPGDADRLRLAAYLLDHGMSPETLMKELGLDPTPLGLRKYDPDEPRNPAGSGRASGQWTKGSASQAYARALLAARALNLADALGTETLTWLARLPDACARRAAWSGRRLLRHRHGCRDRPSGRGRDSPHRSRSCGRRFSRPGNGRRPAETLSGAEDQAAGRKLFDDVYEQYLRDTVNPQRNPKLPSGLTFALPGDTPSGWVHFDDCRESDGTMIEAKGNYAEFLATDIGKDI